VTESEIKRVLWQKYANNDIPSQRPKYRKRCKLKMRYACNRERLEEKIAKTQETLDMLTSLQRELYDA
jgi:hypothetical protein